MTEVIEPLRVHVVASDVQTPSPPPRDRSTNCYSRSIANVLAEGAPVQLLPHAPKRCRASLIVTGTAGDTAFICDSQGAGNQRAGAQIGPSQFPIVVTCTDELWLAQGNGTTIVVGVIAEYD
jgi:hypothetical protein